MQTSYIHSVSQVNTLSQFLLSKGDIERLLVAEPGEDLHLALKETYLAPYIVRVKDENPALAIEQTLIDAKRLVHDIAPKGDMFRVLWLQYDIHNLRVFAKAMTKKMTLDDCASYLSHRGVYDPNLLYSHIETKTLNDLQPNWQETYDQIMNMIKDGKLDEVDGVFDELYFKTCQKIVSKIGDKFIKLYLSNLIDLYNLKSRLRQLKHPTLNFVPDFIDGGTFSRDDILSSDDVLVFFTKLGPVDFWKDALDYYQKTGNFTRLDARAPEYLLQLTYDACKASEVFSSASLVLYYLKCRQAAANIRSIVVGKNSGLNNEDIRSNLRMAYVND